MDDTDVPKNLESGEWMMDTLQILQVSKASPKETDWDLMVKQAYIVRNLTK